MIIYGWGSFNRRDYSVIRGGCQSCGRRGYLSSYTSSKFFTLYFIPLIPLGRQKVVSECPHCKQTLGMSFSEWKRSRATELPRVVAEYEKSPSDEQAAKVALGTIINLQDRPALKRIGPQIRTAFARDANMLTLLAGTYSHLCMDKEADEVYLEAVGLSDDPAIAAEANAHLESEKQKPPRPPHRLLQSLPVLIVPVALMLAFATYVQKAATSHLDNAYVLSGLNRPYRAMINGEEVALQPYQRLRADMLVYGENRIAPTDDSAFLSTQSFNIAVPWYRRPFSGRVVVVNPDQAAVLLWERMGYASGTVPDSAYQYRVDSGSAVHSYDDIDYAFQDFPESITVSSSSRLTYKYRLSALGDHDVNQTIRLLSSGGQSEQLHGYLRARLSADDGGPMAIYVAAALLPADEFMRLAEPRLAARPVLVDWHRAFQGVGERTSVAKDGLLARYTALSAQEPDNSALLYLLSRLMESPDEIIAMLSRAAELPQPSAYAFHGLAYRRRLDGEFRAALAHSNEALRLDPKNEQFQSLRHDILHGLRDYETLEREAGNLITPVNRDASAFYDHVYRLAKLGRSEEAKQEIPRYLGAVHASSALEDLDRQGLTVYLESALPVASGDRAAFVAIAGRLKDPAWALSKTVVAGDLDGALALERSANDAVGVLDHLALYALCQRAGRTDEAAGMLEKAIARLADGGADERRWAEWLRGDEAPDARLAAHVCPDPHNHGVYLIALAQRHPARAGDYLARAAAQRNRDTYYTLALADVVPE